MDSSPFKTVTVNSQIGACNSLSGYCMRNSVTFGYYSGDGPYVSDWISWYKGDPSYPCGRKFDDGCISFDLYTTRGGE